MLGPLGPGKESTLGKTRPPYPLEFKAEAVRLAREPGATMSGVARDRRLVRVATALDPPVRDRLRRP